MYAIELKKVNKERKNFALKDVDLKVPVGFITGFIGPNGSGKSTLIKMIMDIVKPDNGEILIFGQPNEKYFLREKIGFVYDEFFMYEELSLKEIKESIAPFYGNWDDLLFSEYIEIFNLPIKKKMKHFSKGMTMKASLALALSHHPDLIIMDEPSSGLDPLVRREFLKMIRNVMSTENKTVFFSSHITSDLDNLADYIVLISNGKIEFNKDIEEMKENYHLVKGQEKFFSEDLKNRLTWWESAEGICTGLYEGKIADLHLTGHFLVEKPTLDDIMYNIIKGRNQYVKND